MFRLVGFSWPGLGSAILLLFGLGLPSMACQICLPMPTESLADRVLAAEHLVLARENPEKPFTLRTIRTLQEGITAAPPLDLFLDSSQPSPTLAQRDHFLPLRLVGGDRGVAALGAP